MPIALEELQSLVGTSFPGATYAVKGGITGIERKEGRRAGVFDIVTFRLELSDAGGEPAAVSTNSFIFPRRD